MSVGPSKGQGVEIDSKLMILKTEDWQYKSVYTSLAKTSPADSNLTRGSVQA